MCGKSHGLEANRVGADKGNFLLGRAFTKATGSSVNNGAWGCVVKLMIFTWSSGLSTATIK